MIDLSSFGEKRIEKSSLRSSVFTDQNKSFLSVIQTRNTFTNKERQNRRRDIEMVPRADKQEIRNEIQMDNVKNETFNPYKTQLKYNISYYEKNKE